MCQGEDGKECHKKIEDVEVGDLVWAYNEDTGESDWKPVVQLFRNKAEQRTILSVKADDGIVDKITSTPGHKYYLPDNKQNRNTNEQLEHASYVGLNENWVSAGLLKNGDKVLLANADSLTGKPKYGIVVGVKTEECDEFTTYNFEVADFHTYYVGEQGILVHNKACQWTTWENYEKVTVDGKEYAKIGDRLYSDHAVRRMQPSGNRYGSNIFQAGSVDYGRSISPAFIDDILSTVAPTTIPDSTRLLYLSGSVKVITESNGIVVTIITM